MLSTSFQQQDVAVNEDSSGFCQLRRKFNLWGIHNSKLDEDFLADFENIKNYTGDTAMLLTSLWVLDTWRGDQQRKCYCQWKRTSIWDTIAYSKTQVQPPIFELSLIGQRRPTADYLWTVAWWCDPSYKSAVHHPQTLLISSCNPPSR